MVDRGNWRSFAHARRRTAHHRFSGQRERFIRAQIYNGDDQPLPVESLMLAAFRRTVAFPANERGVYWVYYGNPNARPPSYDFGYVAAQPVALGATLGRTRESRLSRAPKTMDRRASRSALFDTRSRGDRDGNSHLPVPTQGHLIQTVLTFTNSRMPCQLTRGHSRTASRHQTGDADRMPPFR